MIKTIVSRVGKLEQRLAPAVETEENRRLRVRLVIARARVARTAAQGGGASWAATEHAGNRGLDIADRLHEGRKRIVQAPNPQSVLSTRPA
jgi:hypothetical protein